MVEAHKVGFSQLHILLVSIYPDISHDSRNNYITELQVSAKCLVICF